VDFETVPGKAVLWLLGVEGMAGCLLAVWTSRTRTRGLGAGRDAAVVCGGGGGWWRVAIPAMRVLFLGCCPGYGVFGFWIAVGLFLACLSSLFSSDRPPSLSPVTGGGAAWLWVAALPVLASLVFLAAISGATFWSMVVRVGGVGFVCLVTLWPFCLFLGSFPQPSVCVRRNGCCERSIGTVCP